MSDLRVVQLGYRSTEFVAPPMTHNLGNEVHKNLEKLVTVDKTFQIHSIRPQNSFLRPIVSASLGPHVKGVVLPKPDRSDAYTALDGVMYRLGREMPLLETKTPFVLRLEGFARKWLKRNLKPCNPDTDVSVETWLKNTNYSDKRKMELLNKFKDMHGIDKKILKVKSFVKDEFYPEYKMARGINSRSDLYKCLVGPWVKVAETVLFSHPAFIKKVPVHERPDYIIKNVLRPGSKTYTTDFTSMESHFTKPVQEALDRVFFEHMLQNIAGGPDMVKFMIAAKTGQQHMSSKTFTVSIEAKKMSGEMDTSCSNGFANLMFILMMAEECGIEVLGVTVEGDDGIFSTTKPVDDRWFKNNGLLVKLDEHIDISTASFCGLVFDVNDGTNVTNPIAAIAKFGWTDSTYAMSKRSIHRTLLKCKALSLAHSYPRCPLLTALANRMIHLTSRYDVEGFLKKHRFCSDSFKEDLVRGAVESYKKGNLVFGEPGMRTRVLVQSLYGIPIADQIHIESYFSSLRSLDEPLDDPILLSHMPDLWKQNYNKYVLVKDKADPNLEYTPAYFFTQVRRRSCLSPFVPSGTSLVKSILERDCAD